MTDIKLSSSLEDYLEAIALIVDAEGHAHVKDIAKQLQIKMPSVTAALRALADSGLIVYSANRPVELTERGRALANKVIGRHRILHAFFHEVLWLDKTKADRTACALEHLIDDDILNRIAMFVRELQQPRTDSVKFRDFLSEGLEKMEQYPGMDIRPLSSLPIDVTAKILPSCNLDGGIVPGQTVVVHAHSLDGRKLKLNLGGKDMTMKLEVAENIWCQLL